MKLAGLRPAAEVLFGVAGDYPGRVITAVVLECRGKIALLRRSDEIDHDKGKWHCITGFVEAGTTPDQQAVQELLEETQLRARDLLSLTKGPELVLLESSGKPWLIYVFVARTSKRRLSLNWEHDAYRWVEPGKVRRFSNRVSWLDQILEACGLQPERL